MTKLAPEWVRTRDPVIRRPARYRWTTAPAMISGMEWNITCLTIPIDQNHAIESKIFLNESGIFINELRIFENEVVIFPYDIICIN